MRLIIKGVLPCVTAVLVFDLHEQLVSINKTATCITHGMEYARLEVSSGEAQLKFVCLRRGILVFLIYLVSGKTHFDNYYYRVNADFYHVNKPVRQIFLNM